MLAVPPTRERSPLLDLGRLFGRAVDLLGDRSEVMKPRPARPRLAQSQRLPFHIPTELRQVGGADWPSGRGRRRTGLGPRDGQPRGPEAADPVNEAGRAAPQPPRAAGKLGRRLACRYDRASA